MVPNHAAQPRIALPDKQVTSSSSAACTAACTSEAGNVNAQTLQALALELRTRLSPADLAKLATILLNGPRMDASWSVEGVGG